MRNSADSSRTFYRPVDQMGDCDSPAISTGHTFTLTECAQLCTANPFCKSFTHTTAGSGVANCFLKQYVCTQSELVPFSADWLATGASYWRSISPEKAAFLCLQRDAPQISATTLVEDFSKQKGAKRFEGDITDMTGYEHDPRPGVKSSATSNPREYWPNATVVYEIAPYFDGRQRQMIAEAMQSIEANTCVKFRQRGQGDRQFVSIQQVDEGCFSSIGRQRRPQLMNLDNDCLEV